MHFERLWGTAFLVRHLVGQGRFPFRPRPAILRLQARNVRRIVEHAFRRVPYYREMSKRLGLSPEDFRTASDLARLPILERRDLQSDPGRFIADGTKLGDCLPLSTSGSSGAPLTVYVDRRTALLAAAHAERYRAVLLEAVGRGRYRETLIVPLESSHQKHTRFWLGATLGLRGLVPRKQVLSLFEPPERLIPQVAGFAPDILHSYGSYIEAFFAGLETWDKPFPRPKAVGFSADGLSEASRRLIRDRFGIPCFGAYSAVEASRIGFECGSHAGLHINEDIYPVRILDDRGRDLPAGETGEVVVSNLVNRTMVILNYRLGDRAAFLPDPCACGRSLPLLSFPEGRAGEWIPLPDGRRVHGLCLHVLLRAEGSVYQYQIVQAAPDRFRLSLVVAEASDQGEIAGRIETGFRRALGPGIAVEVAFVPSIPVTEGGKVRPIISLDPGGRAAAPSAGRS